MFKLLLVVCAFASLGAANKQLANQYVDRVIHDKLRTYLSTNGLYNVRVPDLRVLDKVTKMVFLKEKISVNFTGGDLIGLGDVNRRGDCSYPFHNTQMVVFNCTLTFRKLEVTYYANGKVGSTSESFQSKTKLSNGEIFIDIYRGAHQNPVIRNLIVRHPGTISTSFPRMNKLSKYSKNFKPRLEGFVAASVTNTINGPFRNALNQAVSATPSPM